MAPPAGGPVTDSMTEVASFLAPALAPKFLVLREGERVGFLDQVFGFVYRGRVIMKVLKKSNRQLYYAIKYVTLGGLLTAFIVWA